MVWLLVTFLFVFNVCYADERPGVFYNPPTGGKIHDYGDNQVYDLGETVQMRWATSLDYFSIMLWQNDNSEYEWIQTNLSSVTSYDWIVSTQRNLDHGTVFFFQIRDATDIANPSRLFASHYFNITKKDSDSSSTMSSSTSTRSSSTSFTPTLPLATSSLITTASSDPTGTSSEPPPDSSMSPGLSPQTKVGLGVGISLGGAFLITLSLVIWYFYRRTVRLRTSPYVPDSAAISKNNPPIYAQHQQDPPAEVHGESRGTTRFELPS
ncbi:hypothetical protein BDW42DRAFT_179208 [Aspergillus taichungensis]|uniref:Mid2 domain-containing protein n=1 Tax=Aspergillus taichungensis TaxID=482145 RepID=A0A2J5HH72_9EURO|nr:hypothetical protein BDW42DRAFT_179208 [Aspergillus taichungensis]